MFLNIQIDLLILKTYYGQFTLTTKKSLHTIFKGPTCTQTKYANRRHMEATETDLSLQDT